jgi:hypothetical protein
MRAVVVAVAEILVLVAQVDQVVAEMGEMMELLLEKLVTQTQVAVVEVQVETDRLQEMAVKVDQVLLFYLYLLQNILDLLQVAQQYPHLEQTPFLLTHHQELIQHDYSRIFKTAI